MFNTSPALDPSAHFRAINEIRLAEKNNQAHQDKMYNTLTKVVNNYLPENEFEIYDTDVVILEKEQIDEFEIDNQVLTIPCIDPNDISPVVIKQSKDEIFKTSLFNIKPKTKPSLLKIDKFVKALNNQKITNALQQMNKKEKTVRRNDRIYY